MTNDTFCSAYAAYIAGILINVVGFVGASESALSHPVSNPVPWR